MQSLLGAISNLIENSLHACRENKHKGKLMDIGATLEINDDGTICITISDNGCGISDNNKQQIFEPFYTSRARGTGLGLAVVKTVVSSFKGKIKIDSNVNTGTDIKLIIPVIVTDSFSIDKSELALTEQQQLAGG